MATIEERLTFLEYEQTKLKNDNTELKKTIELQTIAIGALVNKAMLERLNERYDKLFDALIAHDRFTNEQLAELRGQQIELDGKIVGMQTEMRQRLDVQEKRFNSLEQSVNSRFDVQEKRLTLCSKELNRFSCTSRRTHFCLHPYYFTVQFDLL